MDKSKSIEESFPIDKSLLKETWFDVMYHFREEYWDDKDNPINWHRERMFKHYPNDCAFEVAVKHPDVVDIAVRLEGDVSFNILITKIDGWWMDRKSASWAIDCFPASYMYDIEKLRKFNLDEPNQNDIMQINRL
jgi:hypothetical protein